MSAIEKALRQIDGQRTAPAPFDGLAVPMPPAPRDRRPQPGPRWVLLVLAVVLTALLTWSFARGGLPFSRPIVAPTAAGADTPAAPTALPSAPRPFAALPFLAGEEAPASAPLGTRDSRPLWLTEAAQAWSSGLTNEAAALWLLGLRSQSPTTLALRLGHQHTLAQADALYARWADRLPVVVLRDGSGDPGRWMVLALPAPVDLEPAHAELKAAHGGAVQWNSVAHWTNLLAPSHGELSPPAAMGREPTAQTPAQQAVPAARMASEPTAPAKRVAPLSAAAPAAPTQPPAPLAAASPPAANPPPSPAVETPELRRSAAASGTEARTSAPAVRAIDVDFNLLEQQLASGQHAQALEGVQKLERAIGVNWRTRYLAGVALSSLGRWDEARLALDNAQQGNPAHARVPLYLSVAQQELGDHAGAIDTLSLALEKHPAMPELWLNQGHSLQALGRIEEAQLAYWRFLDLSSQRTDLQTQRLWVQSRTTKVN